MKRVWVFVLVALVGAMGFAKADATNEAGKISNVSVNRSAFNPSQKETCVLSYDLAEAGEVTAQVYTADFDLVRSLPAGRQGKGRHEFVWDGLDSDGRPVPDEAYFFCIEASFGKGMTETYDPTVYSGGEEMEIDKVTYYPLEDAFKLALPKPARVSMRIGLSGGPLIATVLDWKAMPQGDSQVSWTGFDIDGVYDVRNKENLSVATACFLLPENSVVTHGNRQYDYFSYTKTLKAPKKPTRPEIQRTTPVSSHFYYPRVEDRAPQFDIEIPGNSQKVPIVKGNLLIRITLHDDFKEFLLRDKFEVSLFLDGRFLFEDEEGYSPFNLPWSSKGTTPGEHYLTIMLSTYRGQANSRTIKIRVAE